MIGMEHIHFTMKEHGFAGHMAVPERENGKAVIVLSGGERNLLPGIKIAERFADFGMTGLAVSLFGAEGLPKGPDRIPVEMILSAVHYLKEKRNIMDISLYGISMGTIFAALAAKYAKVTNLILCSPTHVPFEGTADKKHMSRHSVAAYGGRELPFVRPDFSRGGMNRYKYSGETGEKVTGMWAAYNDAYHDKVLEEKAALHLRDTEARILLVAGTGDEMWNSAYSVKYMYGELEKTDYAYDHKMLLYPGASHLIGVMPNRERNKMLYGMIPLVGIFYRRFAENRKLCMEALEQSEKEIMDWILKEQV